MKIRLALVMTLLLLAGLVTLTSQAANTQTGVTGKQATTSARPKSGGKKKTSAAKAMRGVPKGVQACIDRLIEIASADPLPVYEGHPEQIINGGLLWNDPKSRCSIGSDASIRLKTSQLVTAWRTNEASKVRSLLQELKSAAPQS